MWAALGGWGRNHTPLVLVVVVHSSCTLLKRSWTRRCGISNMEKWRRTLSCSLLVQYTVERNTPAKTLLPQKTKCADHMPAMDGTQAAKKDMLVSCPFSQAMRERCHGRTVPAGGTAECAAQVTGRFWRSGSCGRRRSGAFRAAAAGHWAAVRTGLGRAHFPAMGNGGQS